MSTKLCEGVNHNRLHLLFLSVIARITWLSSKIVVPVQLVGEYLQVERRFTENV